MARNNISDEQIIKALARKLHGGKLPGGRGKLPCHSHYPCQYLDKQIIEKAALLRALQPQIKAFRDEIAKEQQEIAGKKEEATELRKQAASKAAAFAKKYGTSIGKALLGTTERGRKALDAAAARQAQERQRAAEAAQAEIDEIERRIRLTNLQAEELEAQSRLKSLSEDN